jgi:hypothetical protein
MLGFPSPASLSVASILEQPYYLHEKHQNHHYCCTKQSSSYVLEGLRRTLIFHSAAIFTTSRTCSSLLLETKQRSLIYLGDGPDRLRELLLPRSRAYHRVYLTPLACARLLRSMVLWKNLPKMMRSRELVSEMKHILSRIRGTQTPMTIALGCCITQVFSVSLGRTHLQRP